MGVKKLGLGSVIATGVGLVVASSCLLSIGIGSSAIGIPFIISMVIACVLNIVTLMSIAELNSLMPDLTGGLAQYSLACVGPFITIICTVGGYVLCNTIAGSVEGAMFGNTIAGLFDGTSIPPWVFCVVLVLLLMIANLNGVDVFIKIQDFVAYALIGSLVIMGIMMGLTEEFAAFLIFFGWAVAVPVILGTAASALLFRKSRQPARTAAPEPEWKKYVNHQT